MLNGGVVRRVYVNILYLRVIIVLFCSTRYDFECFRGLAKVASRRFPIVGYRRYFAGTDHRVEDQRTLLGHHHAQYRSGDTPIRQVDHQSRRGI